MDKIDLKNDKTGKCFLTHCEIFIEKVGTKYKVKNARSEKCEFT